jgi:predicted nucleotide-binding protein
MESNLSHFADVTTWSNSARLSAVLIDSLINDAKYNDFGIFVFTAEDTTSIRGQRKVLARDNVVFEAGIFMGAMGRERTFIVKEAEVTNFQLPGDLDGLVYTEFTRSSVKSREAATRAACLHIIESIEQLNCAPVLKKKRVQQGRH